MLLWVKTSGSKGNLFGMQYRWTCGIWALKWVRTSVDSVEGGDMALVVFATE